MKQPLVSVIIPVYNVETYLEQCLDSLLAQELTDFELICVNDGSTDSSALILERYVQKDDRIRIITQANSGLAAARDTALNEVRGKYLAFVDSDDYVLPAFLSVPVGLAEAYQADVVLYNALVLNEESKELSTNPWMLRNEKLPRQLPFSYRDAPESILQIALPNVWTKLFSSRLIKENPLLRFGEYRLAEDVPFSYTALLLAKRIVAVDEPLYVYRWMRAGSLTKTSKDPQLYFAPLKKLHDNLQALQVLPEIITSYWQRTVDSLTFELTKLAGTEAEQQALSYLRTQGLAELGLDIEEAKTSTIPSLRTFSHFDLSHFIRYQKLSLSDEVDVAVPLIDSECPLSDDLLTQLTNTTRRVRLLLIDIMGVCEQHDLTKRTAAFLQRANRQNIRVEEMSFEPQLTLAACINRVTTDSRNHLVVVFPHLVSLPPQWLERLLLPLYADNTVSTASPCSNRGQSIGMPAWWLHQSFGDKTPAEIDAVFSKLIPTAPVIIGGSPSCVAINRRALNTVGDFDDTSLLDDQDHYSHWESALFAWRLEARKHDFHDSLAENLFVPHDAVAIREQDLLKIKPGAAEFIKTYARMSPKPEIMKRIEARLELEALLNSKSWRITKPLRMLTEKCRN